MSQPLRETLIASVIQGLEPIQLAFDAYQNACFIARPAEYFALELCGEAGELANLEKKRWKGVVPNEAHTAEEAADVFIALMNFCNARGIELPIAVCRKLERITPNRELD